MGPITTVFSTNEEKELVAYLKLMEGRLFGLSTGDFRKLAYQLAIKNNKNHNFNNDKKEAGYDWLKGFLKRHSDLSLRVPEKTSAARAMGFNKPVVTTFYRLLGEVLDKYKFQSDRIFNCDETGISNVPKCKSKILASKGRKQVGSLTSAERGQTVTVELCVSASGIFMPPMMIFPRVRTNLEYLRNCPPGFTAEFHPSGWMQTDIFYRWLEKFIQFTHASKNNPVLLLLDGHATHTKNINLIDLARENGVVMLCFPPHCTHRLQPLDVGVMKPISTYYDTEVTNWLRSNTPKVVTLKDIGEIFGKAYMKAATMSTAINAFKKTGIFPFNDNVFEDSDFMPAETTHIPRTEMPPESPNSPTIIPFNSNTDPLVELLEKLPDTLVDISNINFDINNVQPSCSNTLQMKVSDGTVFENVSPKDVMPIPQRSNEENSIPKRKSLNRGKTVVLTSSPYKNELETKQKMSEPEVKRKLFKKKSNKSTTNKNKKKRVKLSTNNDDDIYTECLYCGHTYAESNEGWICCQICEKWAHLSCSGKDNEENTTFICENCL